MRLAGQPGVAVPVSTTLYEAVQFALAMAEVSLGALDPTVGYAMENRGFNQEYRTRRTVRTELQKSAKDGAPGTHIRWVVESGSLKVVLSHPFRDKAAERMGHPDLW